MAWAKHSGNKPDSMQPRRPDIRTGKHRIPMRYQAVWWDCGRRSHRPQDQRRRIPVSSRPPSVGTTAGTADVCLWHFSDIPPAARNVRYRG